jgi:Leucine-rich repeat (LRR) protein
MNEITDISVLAELKDLETLYLFANKISDITALEGLTELKELHIYGNPIDLDDPDTARIIEALREQGTEVYDSI